MARHLKLHQWFLILLASSLVAMAAQPNQKQLATAQPGFETIARLTEDLHEFLTSEAQQKVNRKPVLLELERQPCLRSEDGANGTNTRKSIQLGKGLVDVLNYIARAKAIAVSEPAYFEKAMRALESADPQTGVPPLPEFRGIPTDALHNAHVNYFHQMAGGLMGIELAHHALGHYQAYGSRLRSTDGTKALNTQLPYQEWRAAAELGASLATKCGLATDGLVVLFEALKHMRNPPAWSIYLIHPQANVAALARTFSETEKNLFP